MHVVERALERLAKHVGSRGTASLAALCALAWLPVCAGAEEHQASHEALAGFRSYSARDPVQVLVPGDFHGNEVPAYAGKGWRALVRTTQSSALRTASVRVVKQRDVILDADSGPVTGRGVRARAGKREEIIALLRGSRLRPEKLRQAQGPSAAPAVPGPIALQLGRQRYELALDSGCGSVAGRCRWWLTSAGRRQVVAVTDYYRNQDPNAKASEEFLTEGRLELLWAGDLDGDGKLDLVLLADPKENVYATRLVYLSTLAKPGSLVGLAGGFGAVGC